jgi:hypothetical protein
MLGGNPRSENEKAAAGLPHSKRNSSYQVLCPIANRVQGKNEWLHRKVLKKAVERAD